MIISFKTKSRYYVRLRGDNTELKKQFACIASKMLYEGISTKELEKSLAVAKALVIEWEK